MMLLVAISSYITRWHCRLALNREAPTPSSSTPLRRFSYRACATRILNACRCCTRIPCGGFLTVGNSHPYRRCATRIPCGGYPLLFENIVAIVVTPSTTRFLFTRQIKLALPMEEILLCLCNVLRIPRGWFFVVFLFTAVSVSPLYKH